MIGRFAAWQCGNEAAGFLEPPSPPHCLTASSPATPHCGGQSALDAVPRALESRHRPLEMDGMHQHVVGVEG